MVVPPALLELVDVSYRLNDRSLFQALSFSLAPGEFVMLRGPSGSGKSTLLKLMAVMLTPESGRILFNGQDIAALEPVACRRQISYGFQSPQLFGDTVRDNLAFPYLIRNLPVDEQRIRDGPAQAALPETMLAKPVTALSGGENRRAGEPAGNDVRADFCRGRSGHGDQIPDHGDLYAALHRQPGGDHRRLPRLPHLLQRPATIGAALSVSGS